MSHSGNISFEVQHPKTSAIYVHNVCMDGQYPTAAVLDEKNYDAAGRLDVQLHGEVRDSLRIVSAQLDVKLRGKLGIFYSQLVLQLRG